MSQSLAPALEPGASAAAHDDLLYRKVSLRIIPFLFLCYVVSFLDRINIGFAQLQMKHDLGFSDAMYGLGAAVFYVGYVICEVPSNMLLARFGAPPAAARFGVLHDLAQLLAGDDLFRRGFFLDEPLLFHHVPRAEQQHAFPRQPVPPRPPGFLIITLDVFGQVVMQHEADVGFVDAHAEGNRRANHTRFIAQEQFLVRRSVPSPVSPA